jgi:MFS-type transporter involved in bile tolerance (Atg22 family)
MERFNCRKFSPEKRERVAWYTYDWANSVYVNTGVQMFMPILMSNLFGQDFFSSWVSFSVLVQCIVFISCSALADFGDQRKRLLVFFSISGSLATCLFWFVKSPNDRDLAVFLLVVSNVSYGASFVMYNAYLSPIAAGAHRSFLVWNLAPVLHFLRSRGCEVHLGSKRETGKAAGGRR